MSKKTSRSYLPDDKLTPTEGTAYGLDGYYHDIDYGAGAEEHGRLPSVRGLSSLPADLSANPVNADQDEDILEDTDSMGDISALMAETIPDLGWLEVHEQDVDRLPKDPTNMGVAELTEAWTKYKSGSGFQLSAEHGDLDRLRYQSTVDSPVPVEEISAAQLGKVLARAARRSAAGDSLSAIVRQAEMELGDDVSKLAKELETLKAEHPLAGKVFVRAAAYPGCASGRWTKQVRKTAGNAKYAIQAKKCSGCVKAENGQCQAFQKKLVASIPWEEARRAYAPRLESEGRKLEAGGDPKTALLAAFSSKAQGLRMTRTSFPVKPAVEILSDEEARSRLAQVTPPKKVDFKKQRRLAEEAKVESTLDKWVTAGLLGKDQRATLMASGESPGRILSIAKHLANQPSQKKSSYTGVGIRPPTGTYLDTAQSTRGTSEKVSQALSQKVTRNVRSLIAAKLLPADKAEQLLAMNLSPAQTQRIANLLTRAHQGRAVYEGQGEGTMPFTQGTDKETQEAFQKLATLGNAQASKQASEYAGAGLTAHLKLTDAQAFENLRQAAQAPEKVSKQATPDLGDLLVTLQVPDSRKLAVDQSIVDFELRNSPMEGFDIAEAPNQKPLEGITFEGMIIDLGD